MADDVFGFIADDVDRIRNVVSFVEKSPRYTPKQRRYGGPPQMLWEVCTTTPITAATNAKTGATLFTFHQLIDDGTDATPKNLIADCTTEYRGVNRRSDLTASSGSYVVVTLINGEWRPINVLDMGCDCSCSSSSSSRSSSSSSSSSQSSSSQSSASSSLSSSSTSSASSVLSSSGSSAISSSVSSSVSSSSTSSASSSVSSSASSQTSSQTSSTQSSQGSSGTSSDTSSSQTSSGTSSGTSSSSQASSGSGTSSGSSGSGTSSGSGSGSSASSGCIQVVTDVQCTGGNLVVTKTGILATTC